MRMRHGEAGHGLTIGLGMGMTLRPGIEAQLGMCIDLGMAMVQYILSNVIYLLQTFIF